MSLSRQRERAMFRRLNDTAKMKVALERMEEAEQFEKLNKFEAKHFKKIEDTAFSLLIFVSFFTMANILLYFFHR